MNEATSAVVIELAKGLMELMGTIELRWNKAFFRFSLEQAKYGSNGSYVYDSNIELLDPFKYDGFFTEMNTKAVSLFKLLGQKQGVLLLTVSADYNYDIQYEFQDLGRWRISKMNGATGVPEETNN